MKPVYVAIATIILDQGVKIAMQMNNLHVLRNSHAIFSLPVGGKVMIFISSTFLITLAIVLSKHSLSKLSIPITLVLAGGASNLMDRIVYGSIIDVAKIGSMYFNIADCAIIIGAVLAIMHILKKTEAVQ